MNDLIAVIYPEQERAAKVMNELERKRKAKLITISDAVYVDKDMSGKLAVHQAHELTGAGAVTGALWGLLLGLLFMAPIPGLAIGAAGGALAGHFSDYGIDDHFVKDLGKKMQPGSSGVFLLVPKEEKAQVLEALEPFGGDVLRTSLPEAGERKLREILASVETAEKK